jgi:hypothetical protein
MSNLFEQLAQRPHGGEHARLSEIFPRVFGKIARRVERRGQREEDERRR